MVSRSIARGINFDTDPSFTIGTITVTNEQRPRFVPVRLKFDTGSAVSFIPFDFVEKHALTALLVELDNSDPDENVFVGLINQEYIVRHTITLEWCAVNMHHIRTTQFHVADDIPYDILLGNPFILKNRVFAPQRVALPLRCKKERLTSEQQAEELGKKAERDLAAAQEQQRTRNEDKSKRELEREARSLAKSATSASSMLTPSVISPPSTLEFPLNLLRMIQQAASTPPKLDRLT